jgi:thioredoxin 2
VLVGCAHCAALNRVPQERLAEGPKCGKCKNPLLPPTPVAVSESTFDAAVTRTELPVVVDFWASWCAPCRMMAPNFERVAGELSPRVRFAKLDTEAAPNVAGRFAIRGIPTLILFRNGAEAARVSGAMDARSLRAWVEGAL